MRNIILRPRGVGRLSCRRIKENMNNPVSIVRSDKIDKSENFGTVFHWGCNSKVKGEVIFNKYKSSSKLDDRKILNEKGLSPKTWFNVLELPEGDASYIVRPGKHWGGNNLHFVVGSYKANEAAYLCGDDYYITEYIPKVKEFRVVVAQGRVLFVVEKIPNNPEDIAWNVHQGGRFTNVRWGDWNLRVVRKSVEAVEALELDFGAVDVILSKDGDAYILEVNRAPLINSDYWGKCLSKLFDYIIENGNNEIKRIKEKGGYRKFIHPAVCEEAILGE